MLSMEKQILTYGFTFYIIATIVVLDFFSSKKIHNFNLIFFLKTNKN